MEEAVILSPLTCPGCGKKIDNGEDFFFCQECKASIYKRECFYDLLQQEEITPGRGFWDFRACLYEKMLPITATLGSSAFSYHRAVQEVAQIALQEATPKTPFLDVATGTGLVIKNLISQDQERLYVGLDYSQSMLNRAQENLQKAPKNQVILIRGDAHHLPFTSSFFGGITCAAALGNMKDPTQVVQEMARVTIKGGKLTLLLTLMDQNPRWNLRLCKKVMDSLYRVGQVPLRWFSPEEMKETLETSGYGNISLQRLGGTWQIIQATSMVE